MDSSFTKKMGYTSPFGDSNIPTETSDNDLKFSFQQSNEDLREHAIKTIPTPQEENGEVVENTKSTKIVAVNNRGDRLNQVTHELINVGESIAQEKKVTSAGFTSKGTVIVSQYRTQIASRAEEVWAYKNDYATFEGTLDQAKKAFPDIDFSGLNMKHGLVISPEVNPDLVIPPDSPLTWHPLNEFDAEENGSKPTNWDSYLDATQTAIDLIGLIPIFGDAADIVNGTISLARGNYADAALSFAAAVPFVGTTVGIARLTKKARKTLDDKEGVYDLIVRSADDVKNYVGQSKDVANRVANHFKYKGKLYETVLEAAPIIHKMPGSTKLEREIYEQFVILRKYQGEINSPQNPMATLLNKVQPVGGRYDLKSDKGNQEFLKKAEEIAKKYKLPTKF